MDVDPSASQKLLHHLLGHPPLAAVTSAFAAYLTVLVAPEGKDVCGTLQRGLITEWEALHLVAAHTQTWLDQATALDGYAWMDPVTCAAFRSALSMAPASPSDDAYVSQTKVCQHYGVPYLEAPFDLKVGIARDVMRAAEPIHGLRHRPSRDTTGWFLWTGGEMGEDDDFFQPLHVGHLLERCPRILQYLGMAPGWRFLDAPRVGRIKIWEGRALLDEA